MEYPRPGGGRVRHFRIVWLVGGKRETPGGYSASCRPPLTLGLGCVCHARVWFGFSGPSQPRPACRIPGRTLQRWGPLRQRSPRSTDRRLASSRGSLPGPALLDGRGENTPLLGVGPRGPGAVHLAVKTAMKVKRAGYHASHRQAITRPADPSLESGPHWAATRCDRWNWGDSSRETILPRWWIPVREHVTQSLAITVQFCMIALQTEVCAALRARPPRSLVGEFRTPGSARGVPASSNDERNIMGAWDHKTFGNDDACDWGGDLCSSENLSFVEETLDAVINTGEKYLEAPESSQAIAAAEVVARLQGRFGIRNAYTESVDEWVAAHPQTVPTALAQKAHAALDRILAQPSELLELWEESEDFEAWKGTVTELKSRIQA